MNGDYPLLREALVPLRAQLLPTDIHPEVPGVSQSVHVPSMQVISSWGRGGGGNSVKFTHKL